MYQPAGARPGRLREVVGTVNGHSPGVFTAAEMLRVDQGDVIVQHPLPATR
jgi:hypothetical protein